MSSLLACTVFGLLSLLLQLQRLRRKEALILGGRQGRAVLIDVVQEIIMPGIEAALIQRVVAKALEVVSILRYLLEERLRARAGGSVSRRVMLIGAFRSWSTRATNLRSHRHDLRTGQTLVPRSSGPLRFRMS